MADKRDLTGYQWGVFTVVERKPGGYGASWICRCECGNSMTLVASEILKGRRKSCGCIGLRKSPGRECLEPRIGHPLYHTIVHRYWRNMWYRCTSPKFPGYENYGGRGIRVCDRWQDFAKFAEDMESGCLDGATLDRIDVNGPYSPDNCRWTMRSEVYDWRGKSLLLREWSELLGIPLSTLRKRFQAGWSMDGAFTKGANSLALKKLQ